MFRLLKSTEIDCRVSTVTAKGCSLLLYKDARSDMNVLDETVGAMNWQREHKRDNANCVVSIWDDKKIMWISKEDTGSESFTEKEKGLASDSFKRACFNWGIGRELYTAPFIWINENNVEIKPKGQAFTTYDKFEVKSITYDDLKNIVGIEIINSKSKKSVFSLVFSSTTKKEEPPKSEKPSSAQINELYSLAKSKGSDETAVAARVLKGFKCKVHELTLQQYNKAMDAYNLDK